MLYISWTILAVIVVVTATITIALWSKWSRTAKKSKSLVRELEQAHRTIQQRQQEIDSYVLNVTTMSAKMYAQNQLFLEQTARGAFELVSPELRQQLQTQQQGQPFETPIPLTPTKLKQQKSQATKPALTKSKAQKTQPPQRPSKKKPKAKVEPTVKYSKPQLIKKVEQKLQKIRNVKTYSLDDWMQQ